jgi:Tol biopolymer transport system component
LIVLEKKFELWVIRRLQPGVGSIWAIDLARATTSRITFNASWEYRPVWSPDGSKILFDSNRELSQGASPGNLFVTDASGAGSEQVVLRSDKWNWPDDWSKDGKWILFHTEENNRAELWLLPLFGDRKPRLLFSTGSGLVGVQFSPDGHWLSYVSDESGRSEVYVEQFPRRAGKWQISNAGGSQPRWRGDSKELFFIGLKGELMASKLSLMPNFQASVPGVLFNPHLSQTNRHEYAVTHDGQRFLAITREANTLPLAVLTDFTANLNSIPTTQAR